MAESVLPPAVDSVFAGMARPGKNVVPAASPVAPPPFAEFQLPPEDDGMLLAGLTTGQADLPYVPDFSHTISKQQREAYQPSPEHEEFMRTVDRAMDLPVIPQEYLKDLNKTQANWYGYKGGPMTPRQFLQQVAVPSYLESIFTADPAAYQAIEGEIFNNPDFANRLTETVIAGIKGQGGMTAKQSPGPTGTNSDLVAFATNKLLNTLESGEWDGQYADPASNVLGQSLDRNVVTNPGAKSNLQRQAVGDLFRTFQDGGNAPGYAHWFPAGTATLSALLGSADAGDRIGYDMDDNVFRGRSKIALDKWRKSNAEQGGPDRLWEGGFINGYPTVMDPYTFEDIATQAHIPQTMAGKYFGSPVTATINSGFGTIESPDVARQRSSMGGPTPERYSFTDPDQDALRKARAGQLERTGGGRLVANTIPFASKAVGGEYTYGPKAVQMPLHIGQGFTNPYALATLGAGVATAGGKGVLAGLGSEVGQEMFEEAGDQVINTGDPFAVASDWMTTPMQNSFVARENEFGARPDGTPARQLIYPVMGEEYPTILEGANNMWQGYKDQDRQDYERQFGPIQRPVNTGIQKYR